MNNKTDYSYNSNLLQSLRNGDKNARELLIKNNQSLIIGIVKRFSDRGKETEDLIEVGKLGLIKAIDGFDETLGYSFSTYAFPLIVGEIKRFLRDDGIIKISRETKRNAALIIKAKQEYIKLHGKEPKISELSKLCNISEAKITEAVGSSSAILSLQERISDDTCTLLQDIIPDEDNTEKIIEIISLRQALEKLNDFERRLVELRFFKEFTQVNTAKILGVSQVKISRCEKVILEKLKKQLIL